MSVSIPALPEAAQHAFDKFLGPNGEADPKTFPALPMDGPDGKPIRNPDGSVKKFTLDDIEKLRGAPPMTPSGPTRPQAGAQ